MNESPFRTFIELISFDRIIVKLEADLSTLEKEMRELKQQERVALESLEATKNVLNGAQKKVDTTEQDMKALDQKETEKKYRLENVTNHKEYQSIKSEIDILKEKQHQLEKDLLQAWNVLESAKKTYEQKQEEITQKTTQLHAALAEKEVKKTELLASIAELVKQRPEKEKSVPTEWVEKYAAMRSQVADPVVPVVNGNCTACYYKVPEQDLIMLRRNKLLQCKDCYRFLYIETPDQKIESSTTN